MVVANRPARIDTELGLFAHCPELAKEVVRVIDISKARSSYQQTIADVCFWPFSAAGRSAVAVLT